jgi:hypothetical protein
MVPAAEWVTLLVVVWAKVQAEVWVTVLAVV